MHDSTSQQTLIPRPADPRRVRCTACEHTEFVHGDFEARRCFYSECDCGSFTLS